MSDHSSQESEYVQCTLIFVTNFFSHLMFTSTVESELGGWWGGGSFKLVETGFWGRRRLTLCRCYAVPPLHPPNSFGGDGGLRGGGRDGG